MRGQLFLVVAALACALPSGDAASVRSQDAVQQSTVKCIEATGPFSNPRDCGSFFQCEPSGNLVTHQCPAGLEFNAQIAVCDYPQNAGCSSESGQPPADPSEPPAGSTEAAVVTTAALIQTTSQQSPASDDHGGEDSTPTEGSGQPPAEISEVPLASTEDTTAAPIKTTTQQTSAGDGNGNQGGEESKPSQPPVVATTVSIITTSIHNGDDNETLKPSITIPSCPAIENPEEAIQLPNPSDCGSFYKCDAGRVAWLIPCPSDLEYNAKLGVCDYPENAGCSSIQSPSESEDHPSHDAPNYGSGDDADISDDEVDDNTVNPSQDTPVCPAIDDPEEAIQLPNPNSCSSFYKCDAAGIAWLISCPQGLEYNVQLGVCDYSENAGCSSTPSLSSSDEDPTEESPAEDVAESDDPEEPVTLPASAPACPFFENPEEAVQLPNPNDCSSFYKCDASGVAWLLSCPPGLEYNADLRVCDYPSSAGCSQIHSSEHSDEKNEISTYSRKYVKKYKHKDHYKSLPM